FAASLFIFLMVDAQPNVKGVKIYRAVIHRPDGNEIPFSLLDSTINNKTIWIIKNAAERIELNNFRRVGDTLIVQFPVFESQFHLSTKDPNAWNGFWYKAAANGLNTQAMSVYPNDNFRFESKSKKPNHNISGRWAVTFTRANNTTRQSVAEFIQDGNKLTGTFLNR